ncbi:unnamed protein product [Porites evermanni]|uniref:MutL C-terminal dimerisation domain-containing protein n=1 Tax=Porites evermanni TaxID=104178 RepID=A0ABN8LWZ1_9CNID|nr:unnamed protein product [Porites evermanni]
MKTFNALRSSKMKRYQIYPVQLYQQGRMLRKGNFHRLAISSVDQDVVEKPKEPSVKSIVTAQTREKIGEVEALLFRAKIAPESNSSAEKELTKNIIKDRFKGMEVLGQFNLGFIIAKLDNDLFIIDQHASDEKFNLEDQQRNTTIMSQRLIVPQKLELTTANEAIVMDNVEIFQKNGFDFEIDCNQLNRYDQLCIKLNPVRRHSE